MHALTRIVPPLVAAALLSACALGPWVPVDVHRGDSRDDVIRVMGPPTNAYVLPDGRARLEYNHMPAGKKTYMIDFDANGRMASWEQVLDEHHFARIVPGMTMADVQRLIGPPTYTYHYWLPSPANTWLYRFEVMPTCTLFEVSFDAATGQVLEGDYPPDPACPGEWR